jgi:IMP dehydrogenase
MIREGLTFDDVLLVPQHSTIPSRANVDLKVSFKKEGFSAIWEHPIIPANMRTVTGSTMLQAIFERRGLGILHRFMAPNDQIGILQSLDHLFGRTIWNHLGLSVGVKPEDKELVKMFIDGGAEIICVDVAHGDSELCVQMTEWIATHYPNVLLISGNVATGPGAARLWKAGADIVKVGVGPGSLCTTRIETGNGVPQLTALMDVASVQTTLQEENLDRSFPFISDGGIKSAGDIVKALCFADMVMVGNLFAGCDEAPGQVLSIDGRTFKEYVGSSTHKTNHIEGVAAIVPTKGSFDDVLTKLLEGLRSGCSYQGSGSLEELRDNPEFIRITGAGLKESHPHDVILR